MIAALGIDIGGTSVKALLVDGQTVRWTARSAEYSRPSTELLVGALRETLAGRELAGCVGVCVPGIYDASQRAITNSVNVPGLMNIRLDDLLRRALSSEIERIEVVNDAVAATYDMFVTRALRRRLLGIALGTGVVLAVLDDGVPLFIDGNSAGHIGQCDVSIDANPPTGPDGGARSLEAYIGGPALKLRYGDLETFFELATASDPPIRALIRAIRICHAIYRPNDIVLVGGVGIRLRRIVESIKSTVAERLTNVARDDWTLTTGDHAFHAATGAARIALQKKTEATKGTQETEGQRSAC